MLIYISVSLSKRGYTITEMAVHSRLGLAIGGVVLVGLAVVGGMGLCSMFGIWATLIIMEVRIIFTFLIIICIN